MDQTRPQILHTHETALLALSFLRLKRQTHLQLIASCYYVPSFASRYLSWGDMPRSSIESLIWYLSIWGFNQADHVIFATEAHRDLFVAQGLETPSTLISNGIDITRYCPVDGSADDLELRYALPPRPRILFVSRLAKDKEIDVLIEAMPRICAARPANLLLVGKGDERPRLEQRARELEVDRHVHFLGFVPEEDMPALYRACDVFAIASVYEVQSLPTLQALATGLPVVAADAVALPELVRDGVTGFLVPPADPEAMGDAVLRILGEADLAHRMGQAGLAIAAEHDERRTFDKLEALYARMIG
jgi:glycosyltransferase involved in cell wall biosynthesis